ncbi:aldose reductase [Panicum miliaceum]|uniref:Aldose reductase n=1 Tax=Panicum miliaceum TaxID=4540 RepID=A0A3L6QYC9_PANMI|nr:aldose reductase [Panicum miliaceum]
MASTGSTTAAAVPEVALPSGDARPMPVIGLGTAVMFHVRPEDTQDAVLAAIELGFRCFDTAYMYGTERQLGDAVAEAVRRGLVRSREEVFVTSKLWCTQCHPDLVVPSLRETLHDKNMLQEPAEYLDLYLIHQPICQKPGPPVFPAKREDARPFDFKGVWQAMEECQRLGLARAIGVEVNPVCQQQKLRTYCAEKGIHWNGEANAVLESEVLAEIAKARGKTVAQVSLRCVYEQGVSIVVKTYNKERLKQNLELFDWELTDEDRLKISQIPQKKLQGGAFMFYPEGEFTSVDISEINFAEE